MPPSGYNLTQADAIVAFLRSCSEALKNEASERNELITNALTREIENIERHLLTATTSPIQKHVLDLTSSFYADVLRRVQYCSSFSRAVRETLAEINCDIRAIHVDEPGNVPA